MIKITEIHYLDNVYHMGERMPAYVKNKRGKEKRITGTIAYMGEDFVRLIPDKGDPFNVPVTFVVREYPYDIKKLIDLEVGKTYIYKDYRKHGSNELNTTDIHSQHLDYARLNELKILEFSKESRVCRVNDDGNIKLLDTDVETIIVDEM